MTQRTAIAALLLLLGGPVLAAPNEAPAIQDARRIGAGNLGNYDGGCSGGSCGFVPDQTVCTGASCRINDATEGALRKGNFVVADRKDSKVKEAVVPAPELKDDAPGAINKKGGKGFLGGIFGSKGFMFGAGGAVVGAGAGFLIGGPIGALIGAAVGGLAGWLLTKFL